MLLPALQCKGRPNLTKTRNPSHLLQSILNPEHLLELESTSSAAFPRTSKVHGISCQISLFFHAKAWQLSAKFKHRTKQGKSSSLVMHTPRTLCPKYRLRNVLTRCSVPATSAALLCSFRVHSKKLSGLGFLA
jgi:hypothetical protein